MANSYKKSHTRSFILQKLRLEHNQTGLRLPESSPKCYLQLKNSWNISPLEVGSILGYLNRVAESVIKRCMYFCTFL